MEATYFGIYDLGAGGRARPSTEVDAVRQAWLPEGDRTVGLRDQHGRGQPPPHKPVLIGEIKADGQFKVVWKTPGPVRAQAWSPYIPESSKKVADWTFPWACGNCTEPKFASATKVLAKAPDRAGVTQIPASRHNQRIRTAI